MTCNLTQLVALADELMQAQQFRDYCPNGLQVQGKECVLRLASGVTASLRMLDAAIAWHADAIVVHHGWFWKGEPPNVTGLRRRRLGTLLAADISLLAYHLPLDAHPELGNNARLGALLGIHTTGYLPEIPHTGLGNVGELETAVTAAEFSGRIEQVLGRKPLHIGNAEGMIKTIAWCTGAAQDYIEQAALAGVDAYVSGEVSEPTVHAAREYGIHYFGAGHHATERYGVAALGERLAADLGLEHHFFDIDNPV